MRHPLRSEFLEASPVKTREKRAAFVGSLVGRKGAPDGVRAFLQTAPNDWMFDVVGGGELLTSLQTKVAQSGRNNVRFHGVLEVNKLLEVLAAASVFLLPTYVDTGPTALKEAIALGLWPICYDNSGPAELLRRYEVGSLVKTGDIAMLASTVSDVLGAFGEDSAHRIDVASKAIRRDLHPNAIWPRLLELYR
ncbi:MAG TPA: glycosyltransferase [Polyangiaceae bacterium]